MLDRFTHIRNASDVLAFAKRFGVLGICKHGLPASHNPPPQPHPSGGRCAPSGWTERSASKGYAMWDPIDRWLHFARLARTLLDLGAALHGGKPGPLDLWEEAYEDYQDRPDWEDVRSELAATSGHVPLSRALLSRLVNEWLRMGLVRMSFRWDSGERVPRPPEFAADTFGIIGVQLALTIAGAEFYRCDVCGRRYARTGRRPQKGRRTLCERPECKKEANRLRVQTSRDKEARFR